MNPIVILPDTLAAHTESLAKNLAGSVTLGAGQFCTNPGLVFVLDSPALAEFEQAYAREVGKVTSMTMLTEGIPQYFVVFHLRGVVRMSSEGRLRTQCKRPFATAHHYFSQQPNILLTEAGQYWRKHSNGGRYKRPDILST